MKKMFLFLLLISAGVALQAQPIKYVATIKAYQKDYVLHHEVVAGKAKKKFRFFKPDERFSVQASFVKLQDSTGFVMKTSGTKDKKFFRYGKVSFSIHGKEMSLTIYQNQELLQDMAYKNYLFLPFTDLTSGGKSYGGGRYLDLEMNSIQGNVIRIDFNKAYNPYCAYAGGYNCPVPPRENDLPIAILAGEKAYAGKYIE